MITIGILLDACGKTYTDKHALRAHQRKIHKILTHQKRNFTCESCDEKFVNFNSQEMLSHNLQCNREEINSYICHCCPSSIIGKKNALKNRNNSF